MSIDQRSAIDLQSLPSVEGTVLAYRLIPEAAPRPWSRGQVVGLMLSSVAAVAVLIPFLGGPCWPLEPSAGGFMVLVMGVANFVLGLLVTLLVRRDPPTLQQLGRYQWRCAGLLALVSLGFMLLIRPTGPLISAPIYVAVGLSIPAAMLLVGFWPERVRPRPTLDEEFGSWQRLVEQLQRSPNEVEQRHSFLGVIEGTAQPMLLDDRLLASHIQVTGATRTGKSSRGLMPLAIQAIRRRNCGLYYFDLKGDRSAFGTLASLCREARINFRWLSTETGKSSYVFNPFLQTVWNRLSDNERAQILLPSMSVEFGDAQANLAYFGSQAERILKEALRLYPNLASFAELHQVFSSPDFRDAVGMSRRDFENTGNVQAIVARLATAWPLNVTPANAPSPAVIEGALKLDELLNEPNVLYVWAPATIEPSTARVLTRMFIRMQVATARLLGVPRQQNYDVIDEAQEALQRSLSPVLKQARDMRISVWLGHQNLADLEAAGSNMLDVVLGNTSARIFFSANDPTGREYLRQVSGETRRLVRSQSVTQTENAEGVQSVGTTAQIHEQICERMSPNQINRLNAREGLCLVEAAPKSGFTQLNHPVLVRTPYFCSSAVYQRLAAIPWPAGNRFTVLNELRPVAAAAPPPAAADAATSELPPAVHPGAGSRPARPADTEARVAVEPQLPPTTTAPAGGDAADLASELNMAAYLLQLAKPSTEEHV